MRRESCIWWVTATFFSFVTAKEVSFPGLWTRNIQAPDSSRIVRCSKAAYTEGYVEISEQLEAPIVLREQGALVTFECPQVVGGRLFFKVDEEYTSAEQNVGIAFSRLPTTVGRKTDASTSHADHDLTQFMPLERGNYNYLDEDHIRGAFQYVTLFVPAPEDPKDGQAVPTEPEILLQDSSDQKRMGRLHGIREQESIGISDVGVVFTAAAGMKDPRAYKGFFNSSDEGLNSIWYSGAYDLQLRSIPSDQGGPPVDLVCVNSNQTCAPGQWQNNFTISNSSSVIVDGANQNRIVSSNLLTAIPGIAYSTYDMPNIKNTVETLLSLYPCDTYCRLETVLATYQYILFSADFAFLDEIWPQYIDILFHLLGRVNPQTGFLSAVASNKTNPEHTGETVLAQGMFSKALSSSISLATWLAEYSGAPNSGTTMSLAAKWRKSLASFRTSFEASSMYAHAKAHGQFPNSASYSTLFPERGNIWAVYANLFPSGAVPCISNSTLTPDLVFLAALAATDAIPEALSLMRRKPFSSAIAPAATSFLSTHILGLQLVEPAGRRWRIEPRLGDLRSVMGGLETTLGKFIVSLKRTDEGDEVLEVVVPQGTQGFVIWGGGAGVHIREGGKWRWTKGQSGGIVGGKVVDGKEAVGQKEWRKKKEAEERKGRGHDEL
ncbi:hypothetical protein EDC01DRAFT_189433 [Geopyxis carbonaria]|nr:hypothetical protein EDC01DRAFT_189433 [Geopyxis carbonaria]